MRRLVYLVAPCLLAAAPAAARDIFVNNLAGSDLAPRTVQFARDPKQPARTIAAALRAAAPGDRIVLARTEQPYRETISFVGNRLSGTPYQPLMLLGNGAILDGTAPIPPDAWQIYEGSVFVFAPRVPGDQQLFLAGRPVPYVPADPGASFPPTLKPLQWSLVQGLIFFCVEPDKLPGEYPLGHSVGQTGITFYHVRGVTVVDLVVQGFRVDGIQAANSAQEIQLINVTARGNGRAGITVGGASHLRIEGCTIGDNRTAQLLTLPLSETHVAASDLLPLTAPAWVDQGGRFFLADKRLEGGLSEIRAQD